ncbi:MAG: hypothetical protein KAU95_00935 [Candidatus Aenigmarchaeota archaeon]|nr:hypothetical protein [Candidatus Aenigmarchaeota archaeon]
MRGSLTTEQIFWIIVFMITFLLFISVAVWSQGYGIGVLDSIFGLLP